MLHSFRSFARTAPLKSAFATCFVKGSASDLVAQTQVEKAIEFDWRRNLSFAFFSGAYLGIGQHYIYNIAFTRLFGAGHDFRTALKKVVADSLVHVPMIYLPLYYPFKAAVLGEGSALNGLRRYRADAYDVVTTYWTMWPMFHLFNFTLMPSELRISSIACVSFVWLVFLSYRSHTEEVESGSGAESRRRGELAG